MNAGQNRLLQLPDELLHEILTHLPPRDLVACQLTCKTLDGLCAESLVWRRHCETEYRRWDKSHDFVALLAAPPISVKWKHLLAQRRRQDQHVREDIDCVLSSQTRRIDRIKDIASLGYDATDELLRHVEVADDAEDVLARRFWAAQVVSYIARAEGLEEWISLAKGANIPLERAFGVFDLLIAENPPETLEQISRHFDVLVDEFRGSAIYRRFKETDLVSEKAQLLASWLLAQGLAGMPSEARFRDFKNTLISIAICERDHSSIPIVSVAIYCSVAQRLGIDAHPCGYPLKVLAVIMNNTGYPSDQGADPTYLDPSSSSHEIPLVRLRTQLSAWGIPSAQHPQYLRPASIKSLLKRVARNLEESLGESQDAQEVLDFAHPTALRLTGRTSLRTTLHPMRIRYATDWVDLLFSHEDFDVNQASQLHQLQMQRVVHHIISSFPGDIAVLKRLAESTNCNERTRNSIQRIAEELETQDAIPPPVQRRSSLSPHSNGPKFIIGQVFRHKRYGYTAAITGWDDECKAGDSWIHQMGVDSLPAGRGQPFYNVVVAGEESTRYVAEENIKLLTAEELLDPPEGLGLIAGRYFKRWDKVEGRYMSNLRDQYPED